MFQIFVARENKATDRYLPGSKDQETIWSKQALTLSLRHGGGVERAPASWLRADVGITEGGPSEPHRPLASGGSGEIRQAEAETGITTLHFVNA